MECIRCGAELASRSRPCLFCGEPYKFQSPIPLTSFHRRGFMALLILAGVVLFVRCTASLGYQQGIYLRSAEMAPALEALQEGRTQEARDLAAPLHRSDWYSGFPGAVIAASYYRDYMSGSESALRELGRYAEEAHDRDPSFVTRYYYALYLYHTGDYELARTLLKEAEKELSGVSRWIHLVNRRRWQRALGQLRIAAEQAQEGDIPKKPVSLPPGKEPEGNTFAVEFAI